jgi:DNA-binding transcriptional LysR family regulator
MVELDVRKLRVLRELDERGTVGAVAEALHLTPSAVSQQLAALSREVGVPLLEPAGRRVRLTGAARVLLGHAHEIFARMEHLRADLAAYSAGETGQVRVAGFSTALTGLVLPAFARLRADRPGLAPRLREADPPASFALLTRGDADLVVGLEAARAPATSDRRFHRVPLLTDRLDVALPATHPLAGAPSPRLAQLAAEPWIFGSGGACRDITLAACAAAGFTPEPSHLVFDWDAVLAMVQAGLGVAMVPRLAGARARDGVVVRALAADRPARHVFAVVREGSQTAPHLAAVLAALRAEAADRDHDRSVSLNGTSGNRSMDRNGTAGPDWSA